MGNKQSVQSQPTEKKMSGLFNLTEAQSNTLKIISDLFDQLLLDKENNIFSLEKVLSSTEHCSSLVMILTNTLEKDFHSLHFPDPLVPDKTVFVRYMLQSDYKDLDNQPNRKSLCSTLIFFMIRLVTLVAALTSSLQTNRNIVNLLDLIKYETTGMYNKRFKNPKLDEAQLKELKGRIAINETILSDLKLAGLTRVLKDDGVPDPRALYYYKVNENAPNPLVIDTEKSILYFSKGESTSIFSFQIKEIPTSQISRIEKTVPQLQMPYGYPQQPPMYRYPAQPPQLGGRTRNRKRKGKAKRSTIRIRRSKKFGGAETVYSITIGKLFCPNVRCQEYEFYMDNDGTTYKVDDYLARLRGIQATIPSMSLQDRVTNLNRSDSYDAIPLIEMKEDALPSDKFTPLSKVDIETLNNFRNIQKTLKTKQEGTSPCFYRAFVLSSRLDSDNLKTLLCADDWSSKRVTDQVSYSLLQELYYDRSDVTMDSRTEEEYKQMVDSFSSVMDFDPASGSERKLSNYNFRPASDEIRKSVCVTAEKGGWSIREPKKKEILMDAHVRLHVLFENHIKSCLDILLKIMSLEVSEGYLSKPKIQLDSIFTKDKQGSLHALEEFIKEARQMLAKHYLEVETIYQNALNEISRITRGNAPPIEKGDILAKVEENLPTQVPPAA